MRFALFWGFMQGRWQFRTGISGQPISPIFKDQAVLEIFVPKHRYGITILRRVKPQKSGFLIYTTAKD